MKKDAKHMKNAHNDTPDIKSAREIVEENISQGESVKSGKGKKKKSERVSADKAAQILKQLSNENTTIAAERDEWRERAQRIAAEFENYKKRQVNERARAEQTIYAGIMLELLDLIDNFERAMESAEQGHDFDAMHKGLELIHKQLSDVLKKFNVEEIAAEGAEFDPDRHEAFMTKKSSTVTTDTVAEVFQKGYIMGDRILRPARVCVAQPSDDPENEESESPCTESDNNATK